MKDADIRRYAGLMEELGLTGLEITEEGQVVRLERSAPTALPEQVPVAVESSAPAPKTSGDYISVRSPMVGVFYAAPTENADPYVAIGDHVEKGCTLCIIEAMKLMSEIPAEESGVITEICVTNGQVVEFGTELFRMKR